MKLDKKSRQALADLLNVQPHLEQIYPNQIVNADLYDDFFSIKIELIHIDFIFIEYVKTRDFLDRLEQQTTKK